VENTSVQDQYVIFYQHWCTLYFVPQWAEMTRASL